MALFSATTCLRLLEDRSLSLEILKAELDRTNISVDEKQRVLKSRDIASKKLLEHFKSRPKAPVKRTPISDKVDSLARSVDEMKASMVQLAETVQAVKSNTAAIALPPRLHLPPQQKC